MKNKLDLIPLLLYLIISILSFVIGNIESGLGWLVATMLQLKLSNFFGIFNDTK